MGVLRSVRAAGAPARVGLESLSLRKTCPDLLSFGAGEVSTGGDAPSFVVEWRKSRLARVELSERDRALALLAA
jgi:hypothetical protein